MLNTIEYVVEMRDDGRILCLPRYIYYEKNLTEITCYSDMYTKHLDLDTGEVYDSKKYWEERCKKDY